MKYSDIPVTTLEEFDDFNIAHKELIYANVCCGANFVKDFMATVTDTLGGRSGTYEKTIDSGSKKAIEILQKKAQSLGANAVVRVSFEFNSLGKNGTILAVHAYGTAVVLSDK